MMLKKREKIGFYDNTKSNYFKITSTGKIEGSATNHTIVTVIQKIIKENGPIILTHYWNDNSFFNHLQSRKRNKLMKNFYIKKSLGIDIREDSVCLTLLGKTFLKTEILAAKYISIQSLSKENEKAENLLFKQSKPFLDKT